MNGVCKIFSLGTSFALIACAFFLSVPPAEACTAVYVGKEVSADGSYIIARCNDSQGVLGNHIDVIDRVENQPGRKMPIDDAQTVFEELPSTTYKCVCYVLCQKAGLALKNADLP